ncbi:MAG: hypothetical protein QM652_14030, partial [Legionella sp.]
KLSLFQVVVSEQVKTNSIDFSPFKFHALNFGSTCNSRIQTRTCSNFTLNSTEEGTLNGILQGNKSVGAKVSANKRPESQ